MGIMKFICGLGKFVGKGNVRCIDCVELSDENKCHGVKMEDVEKFKACLFYRKR